MSSRRYHRIFALAITGSAVALASACADTPLDVGARLDDIDASAPPPSFTPQDSGGDSDAPSLESPKLCIATSCTEPYTTCGNGYPCSVNLDTDSNNCGECGKVCPSQFGNLHMSSTCVAGACRPLCAKEPAGGKFWVFADCNTVLEDGCETNTSTDPSNCGACGNKCADGVRCIDGKCGCDAGLIDCGGECIDPRNNDDHCGACGNACSWPTNAPEPPPHMEYGCVDNQCGQLRCQDWWGDTWADCDKDPKNGCEVFVGLSYTDTDPNNCGKCGNKCTAGQVCWDLNEDYHPECLCANPTQTLCGTIDTSNLGCYDLLSDPDNCGTCFTKCEAWHENTTATCRKGICETGCAPGWGDCDFNPNNGCETNLMVSDGHCGQCGNHCDTQAGQPCINGQCAMTECDAGTVTK
ncbi:hypothetical protein [Labilithrix luteola]|nr:hypothetical protein [Labilithrix luteola]